MKPEEGVRRWRDGLQGLDESPALTQWEPGARDQ